MADFRDLQLASRSKALPPLKLERKMSGVLSLSPQRHAPIPILHRDPYGSLYRARDICESANQLSPSLVKQLASIAPNPKHLEQVSAKDQTRFLLHELKACRRELGVQIAQLMTPALSERQEVLEGLRICPESDVLAMEPSAPHWNEFLR